MRSQPAPKHTSTMGNFGCGQQLHWTQQITQGGLLDNNIDPRRSLILKAMLLKGIIEKYYRKGIYGRILVLISNFQFHPLQMCGPITDP